MYGKRKAMHRSAAHIKILALAAALSLLCSLLPAHVFATGTELSDEYLCGHSHDEVCGYTAIGEGTPCAHVHDDICGYAESEACSHLHDEKCGYAEPSAGTPCTHICKILSFNGHTPGEAVGSYDAEAGEAYELICAALPETLPGTLACTESAEIPVSWSCADFTGEPGTYIFRAELENEKCVYAASDDPLTESIDESELPYITATVPAPEPAPALDPEPEPTPAPTLEPESTPEPAPTTEPAPVSTLTDGAVSVSGELPEGAFLEVTEVPVEAALELLGQTESEILFAYDIRIMLPAEPEPVEYQPGADNPVTVTITPPQPIEAPTVEVLHIAEDAETGEKTPQPVATVTPTENTVEFEAEAFSVYVVTVGANTPRVTFSYDDDSLDVEYSTDGITYTPLSDDVLDAVGENLYFKVTGSPVAVYRDGSTTPMTAANNVYTVDSITANTLIIIRFAVTLDVTHGSIVIGGSNGSGGREYTYYDSQGAKTGVHNAGNIYTIVGTTGTDTTGNGYNVTLTGEGDFNVTLDNVTIYTGTAGEVNVGCGICAPVSTSGVTGNGNINITLVGTNRLGNVSGNPSDSYAALEKTHTNSTLIINGSGTLYATGGADSAGIGSSDKVVGGSKNITINSGTIYATTNGSQGAGIGSGNNASAENIRIYGGNITATGVVNGAGIGGSGSGTFTANKGEVYIYGGTINATSNGTGAGIGGGGSGTGVEATGGAGEVHIYGGTITADSIGGGAGGQFGGAATVNISGGKVTTTGSIGGGNSTSGSGGTAAIAISGGTITAANISGGHGIGGNHAGGTLSVTGGSAKVDHVCDAITPTGLGSIPNNQVVPYTVVVRDTNSDAVANKSVSAITFSPTLSQSYGLTDVKTDEYGKLYLWLPDNTSVVSVTADGTEYGTGGTGGLTQKSASISPASNIAIGTLLTATLTGGIATSWQWQRYTGSEWTEIQGAASQTYTVQPADAGHQLLVIIDGSVYSPSVVVPMPSFTVTIPASITPENASGSFNISGDHSNLLTGQSLSVAVRSAKGFKLAMVDAATNTLPYSLRQTQGGTAIANNGTVATFSGSGASSVPVYYSIVSPIYSGTYTDTLTFTVTFNSGIS